MSNLKTLHFVAVGGTGHKVLQSLIHIAACGAFKGEVGQIRVLTIDADDSNGNLSLTRKTLGEYGKFYAALGGCSELGLVDIRPVIPSVNLRLYREKLNSLGKTFNTTQYKAQTEKLLRFLYTDDEIEAEFDQGFYGHTSIGTIIVKKIISVDDTWKEFLSGINDNEFVMVAGSIFGGTGASAIPVILQELNEKRKGSTNPFNVASLMLTPYFNTLGEIKEEGTLQPDSSTFHVKAKAALYYYNDQRQDKMVNALYIIGEPEVNFSNEVSSRGSVNQCNKAHPMELFAALSALDFVRNPRSDESHKIRTAEREAEKGGSKYYYTWKMIQNNNQDLPGRMQLFTKVAIFYNKILCGELGSGKSISLWRNFYATDDGGLETKRDSDNEFVYQNIFKYCRRFLEWMYDLHKENQRDIDQNTGKLRWEPDARVKLFNAQNAQLFDNETVSNGKIIGFDELVVDQNDGIRSEKLYSELASKKPDGKGFVALFSTLYEIVGKTSKGGIFGFGKKGKPVVHDYVTVPYFSRENDAGLQRSEAAPGKIWSSDSLKLLLNIADGLPMTSGNFTRNDISIPSPWSIFIMNELTLTKEKFSGINTEAYRQWCAMITLLALRKINNYNTLELTKTEDDSNDFFNAVRGNLKPINYVFDNHEWVCSPCVQLKGNKTIAFLANNTLVCPAYSFDAITKAELRRVAPAIIDESGNFTSPDTYFKDQSQTYNKDSKFALSIFLNVLDERLREISATTTSQDLLKELRNLIKKFRSDLDLDSFSYSNTDIAIPTDAKALSVWDVFENMIPVKKGGVIELPFALKDIKGQKTVLIGQEIAGISAASADAVSIYITDDKDAPILFSTMVPSVIEELNGNVHNGVRLIDANSLLCDTMVMVMKENGKSGFESLPHGSSFSLQDHEIIWPIDDKLLTMYSMEDLNNNLTVSMDRENITVSLQLKLEGKMNSHTVTKTYRVMSSDSAEDRSAKNVCLTIDKSRLPFWAVWPFAKVVRSDDNNMWQRYSYLCVEPRYRPGVPVMEIKPFFADDTDEENKNGRSSKWSGSPQRLSSVSNVQRDISYRRSSDLPVAFKLFEKTQDGDIYRGSIFLKKPEKIHEQKEGITWNVGLDFGTTSTTAYFTTKAHSDPRFIQLLPEYKWVEGQDVPPRDSKEGDNAIGVLADFGNRDYLEQCFIDEQTLNQKGYTTTYELLDETEKDTERTIFTTGRIFWHNYKNLRLVNSDSEGKRRERLRTNIKWEGDTTYTGKFLNQLMTQIVYKAASRGAHKINWFFSYPTAFSGRNRGAFGNMLSKITENISTETGIKNEYDDKNLITESIAAAYYFKYNNPRETVFLCLDIGGGTSDVSICVKDKYVFQSSIRFASRDMFIAPLLELLRSGSVLTEVGKADDDRIGNMLMYKGASDSRGGDDKAKFFIETVLFEFYDTFRDRLFALQGENKAAYERFTYRVFIAYSGLIFYVANIVAELLNKKGIDKDEIGQTIILGLSGKGSKLTDWIKEYCGFLYDEAQNLVAEKTKSYATPEGVTIRFKQQFDSQSAKTETAIGLVCNLDHQAGTHTKKLEEKDPEIFLGSEVEVTNAGNPHEIKDKFVNPYEDPFRDPRELSVKIDQNIDALDDFIQFFNSVAAKTRGDIPPVSMDSINEKKKDLRSQINTEFENVRSSGRFDPPFIVILDVFLKECII